MSTFFQSTQSINDCVTDKCRNSKSITVLLVLLERPECCVLHVNMVNLSNIPKIISGSAEFWCTVTARYGGKARIVPEVTVHDAEIKIIVAGLR